MRDFPELVTAATDPVWDDRQKVPAKLETSEAGTQTEGPPGPGVGEEERGTGVPAVSSEGGWLSCQLSSRREGIDRGNSVSRHRRGEQFSPKRQPRKSWG